MKNTLTHNEQRIVELAHTVEIVGQEMQSLLPVKVNTKEFQRLRELIRYRDELYDDLFRTVSVYIQEKAKEEDLDEFWTDLTKTYQNCNQAVDVLYELRDEERISYEEYAIISKPLNNELHELFRYAIGRVLNMAKERAHPSKNSDTLCFLSDL